MGEVTREAMIAAVRSAEALAEHHVRYWSEHPQSSAYLGATIQLAGIQAALRELEAGGWRPIDSYTPQMEPTNVLVAGQYPNGLWYVEETFWRRDGGGHFSGRRIDPPSHWRPLPSPPTTSDGGGDADR